MCEAEGAGSGDSPSRKSPAEDNVDFSGIELFAGNGVGLISPLQLDKIAASMLIAVMADRVLIQASVGIFSGIRAVRVPAGSKVYTSLYHLKVFETLESPPGMT
jgi:hypothetical protein